MKATVFTEYGSLDILQFKDVEIPTPKAHEVLIKVYAPWFLYIKCPLLAESGRLTKLNIPYSCHFASMQTSCWRPCFFIMILSITRVI